MGTHRRVGRRAEQKVFMVDNGVLEESVRQNHIRPRYLRSACNGMEYGSTNVHDDLEPKLVGIAAHCAAAWRRFCCHSGLRNECAKKAIQLVTYFLDHRV